MIVGRDWSTAKAWLYRQPGGDWIFLGKDALLRMLGTPAADKKVVIFDTSHDVSEKRADLVREVAWLDRYFGRVN